MVKVILLSVLLVLILFLLFILLGINYVCRDMFK